MRMRKEKTLWASPAAIEKWDTEFVWLSPAAVGLGEEQKAFWASPASVEGYGGGDDSI